jgi:predicted glycoside hydrolase/deacetylase ChbG (UPF0249 family)
MRKRLIVNADDFGISPGVNRGIVEANQKGIVTSTTLMVNMPYAQSAVELTKIHTSRMGIGLHITLTEGRPVLPAHDVPRLVTRDGTFRHLIRFLVSSPNPEDIHREITAQFRRFVELTGTKPDHIDTHQFCCNWIPAAFSAYVEMALEHNIPMRSPISHLDIETLRDLLNVMGGGIVNEATYLMIRPIAKRIIEANRRSLAQKGTPNWPDGFEFHFYDEGVTHDSLLNILKNLPEGTTEFMCHPGCDRDSGDFLPRELELRLLTDNRTLRMIEALDIELRSFADL